MRVLIPILSSADADASFIRQFAPDASVIYVLLVLDSHSISSKFGFKTSEILAGREAVDKMKDLIKNEKRLCTDILEWGNTIEKISQIAEMKQVDKITLCNAENNPHFEQLADEVRKATAIPVQVILRK